MRRGLKVNARMRVDRRKVLKGAGAGMIAGIGARITGAAEPPAAPRKTRLYIMGTQAGPSVGGARHQTCYAVVVGEDIYVVDCGYGATEQIVHAGLKLQNIQNIYITHHHPDHNIELGTLIYFSWYAGKKGELGIYGPPPLRQITQDYLQALKPDIDIWLDDIGHAPLEPISIHELSAAGPVMKDKDVSVRCALVNHPPVVPALAYRFDTADRSIAFSGDTTPMESVAQLAKGADILVHESIYADAMHRSTNAEDARSSGTTQGSAIAGDADKLYQHIMRSHTKPEDAGRIAQESGVKTLVFAHISPIPPEVTEMMYIEKARTTFKGEIIVAHDLMVL